MSPQVMPRRRSRTLGREHFTRALSVAPYSTGAERPGGHAAGGNADREGEGMASTAAAGGRYWQRHPPEPHADF